jgi:hypothetical protein
MMSPTKACSITTACMRLHNVCIDMNVPLNEPVDIVVDEPVVEPQPVHGSGVQHRDAIIQNFV